MFRVAFMLMTCFLLCCCYTSAVFRALTQDWILVVEVGEAATFTCRTSLPYELIEFRWIRIRGDQRKLIKVFCDGKDQQICELPEYVGRMELVNEGLARGRVSLKVFNVSVADEGAYRCYLGTANYFDFGDLELRVTAQGSDPRIDIEGFQDGGIKAVCRSAGWYPEPTLVNEDEDGEVKIQQKENGLYSVEYSRVIMENSNRTFFCGLRTPFRYQERRTTVNVTAYFVALTQGSPVVIALGDTAVLSCHASIPDVLKEVRWIRIQDGKYSIINTFKDGKDQQICNLPEYVGRTEMMKEDLARGIVALKLFNVSVADEGAYRCYLQTINYFSFSDLELRVTALGSDPRIGIEGFQDGGVKAVCRSAGWYPEPALENKDDDGEMTMQKEENGLYSIEYSRVIKENSNRTFSCRLRTTFPNQERETSVDLADDLFRKRTDTSVVIVISTVMAAFLAVLMATFIYRRYKQERLKKQQDDSLTMLIEDNASLSEDLEGASSEANTKTPASSVCAACKKLQRLLPDKI